MEFHFTQNDFEMLEDEKAAAALIKLAAFKSLQEKESASERRSMSIKYQVLCEETAIIGVIKQKNQG